MCQAVCQLIPFTPHSSLLINSSTPRKLGLAERGGGPGTTACGESLNPRAIGQVSQARASCWPLKAQPLGTCERGRGRCALEEECGQPERWVSEGKAGLQGCATCHRDDWSLGLAHRGRDASLLPCCGQAPALETEQVAQVN